MGDQEGGDGRPGGRGWETRREGMGDQEGMEGRPVWAYDLQWVPVVLVCTSFWIACGAVCYNNHVCSNLIATCRNHSLKDHSHGVFTTCNNLLF